MTQIVDGRGATRNCSNDTAGRMTGKTFPMAAAENVTYSYNSTAGGNFGVGRLMSLTDESGSTAFVYDQRGNVLTETRTIAGQVYTVGYLHDLADRVIEITYPSGRIVTYIRDVSGTSEGPGRIEACHRSRRLAFWLGRTRSCSAARSACGVPRST